jgi:hypothetical protein
MTKRLDPRDETTCGRNTLATAHRLAHARQFIQRRLRQRECAIVGRNRAAVDLHEESLEFVGQVTHGNEAGHACAALECVQWTLERRQAIDTAAIFVPLRQRTL